MDQTIPRPVRICIIALLLISFSYSGSCQNTDIDILKNLNIGRNKILDGLMTGLTNSVYPIASAIPIVELVAGYKRHDTALIRSGWTTVAGLGVNFIVTFGLKYGVNRPRPYVTYPVLQPYQHDKDPSFPSGHTSFSFNTATSLYLTFPKWYVAVPAYTWAASVAYSRMHLGMHYPSDVLAGAIIGTGSALLAHEGNKWLTKHKKKQHS